MSETLEDLLGANDLPLEKEYVNARSRLAEQQKKSKHEIMKKGSFIHYLLFFIVAAIIIYAIFFFFKFSFVQSKDLSGVPTGSLDQSRAILWSVVIGLIITVLVYLLMVPRNKW
jgi:magnesium-transporting ATPase (P-type)